MEALDPWDFTCLLPVHAGDNAAHFVLALESVAMGTLAPTVIMICQDGDLPADLAAIVADGMQRFGAQVARNPGSKGLHHNLNHAAGLVETPWLCRADADDLNAPDRFAAQVDYLREHPQIDVLGGAIAEFWPSGASREKPLPTDHADILRWARYRSPINHMTAFIRVAAFRAAGGYPDLPRKEDYGLWIKLIAHGRQFANLPRVLVRARLGDDFYDRRAGTRNLATEWRLLQMRRAVPGLGGLHAWVAFAARSAALALRWPAEVIYERILRR